MKVVDLIRRLWIIENEIVMGREPDGSFFFVDSGFIDKQNNKSHYDMKLSGKDPMNHF